MVKWIYGNGKKDKADFDGLRKVPIFLTIAVLIKT